MSTPELPDNLFIEALKSLGFDRNDYFAVSSKFAPETLNFYLQMAFSIGFDIAYEQAKKESHGSRAKKLVCINEFGVPSKPYNSIRDASKVLGLNESNLQKSIKIGKKYGGYFWRFVE